MAEIPQTFPAIPVQPLRPGDRTKRDKKGPPMPPKRHNKDKPEPSSRPDPDQPGIDEYA